MQIQTRSMLIPSTILIATVLILATLTVIPVFAGSANNVGQHAYKINIIGRMQGTWGGDDTGSNSKVVFIGLKTATTNICEPGPGGVTMVKAPATVPVGGEKIYFYTNTAGTFDVEDRDATDGIAIVSIPAAEYDVYVRILGGSNKNFKGCLDADAYFLNHTAGDVWYKIGHLDANRINGQPAKIDVKSLFYQNGVPLFDATWQDYFWQITNDGLRNMQLIFYETQ